MQEERVMDTVKPHCCCGQDGFISHFLVEPHVSLNIWFKIYENGAYKYMAGS